MWLYNFPTDPVSKPTSKSMRTALSRPSAGRLPGPPHLITQAMPRGG